MIKKGFIRFKKGAYKPYWHYPRHGIVFLPHNKRRP